jgi:hypothetical protein
MRVKVPFIFSSTDQGQPKITFMQRVLMYYRIPGLFSIPYALAPSPSPVSKLSLFLSLPVSPVELTDGREGVGAKSYDGEKAWSSINHAILSALMYVEVHACRWMPIGRQMLL